MGSYCHRNFLMIPSFFKLKILTILEQMFPLGSNGLKDHFIALDWQLGNQKFKVELYIFSHFFVLLFRSPFVHFLITFAETQSAVRICVQVYFFPILCSSFSFFICSVSNDFCRNAISCTNLCSSCTKETASPIKGSSTSTSMARTAKAFENDSPWLVCTKMMHATYCKYSALHSVK